MRQIIRENPPSQLRIKPFVTGEDVNNDPKFSTNRYVIDLNDLSLTEAEKSFPELVEIVRRRVYPVRQADKRENRKENWWRFGEQAKGLYSAISGRERVLCTLFTSSHLNFSLLTADAIFANAIVVTTLDSNHSFAPLQSRTHEAWARFFSSSLEDRLRYAPSDCFLTFPLPALSHDETEMTSVGDAYYTYRTDLMRRNNQGLTATYNRFHDPYDEDPAIQRLRELHAEMDRAVLRAYGWDDLAETADPVFLTEETETEFTYQGRLFWPSDFRDEVLARLLDLNRARHAAEANEGIAIATAPDAPHSAARPKQTALDLGAGPLFDRTEE
jgi:hypothetical protein